MTTKTKVKRIGMMTTTLENMLPTTRVLVEVDDAPTLVCDGGWGGLNHPRIVLKFGAADQVSHGLCERCRLMCDAEMRGLTGQSLNEYRAYLETEMDPRD